LVDLVWIDHTISIFSISTYHVSGHRTGGEEQSLIGKVQAL
jgi:hypothetical protein